MKRLSISFFSLICSICLLSAQKAEGVVFDETGERVIGVTVMVKGTTRATFTDHNGYFSITANEQEILLFTYMGYLSQELKPAKSMRVTLKPTSQELQEVVVTGMVSMDKRLFTGASNKIDAEKAKIDGMTDISRSLEGRAAGVSVQNVSGTFGAAPKIRVRGATSIFGNSKPLWVVDGVIMEDVIDVSSDDLASGDAQTLISSAIAGLNADDIESFQILKDGSATSIYGARAMAGVIVITTKKGKPGVSKLNYTGEFTTRMKPDYSNFNISNSQQQMGIYQELERKGWIEAQVIANSPSSGVYGKMYQLITQYDKETDTYGLKNDEAYINAYLRQAEFRNTDWFDLLFSNSLSQNHSVSFSSGTDKARFYVSMSAFNDPGWTRSGSVARYTANVNASYNISKTLMLSVLSSGSTREQKAPGTIGSTPDVISGEIRRDFDINPFSYALNTSRTLDPNEFYTRNYAPFNIFHELDNNYIDLNTTDAKFQGELSWKPIRGMEIKGLVAYKTNSSVQEHHIKDFSNQAEAYRVGTRSNESATIRDSNPLLYKDPDETGALPISILPEGGIYSNTTYSMKSLDFRLSGTYNTDINNIHIMNFYAGVEGASIDRNSIWFRGWGFQYDNGEIPFFDYRLFKQAREEGSDYYYNIWDYSRSAAYFGTATYSYLGKYTVNFTGRYEGTNRLGKSKTARWLPTWNVGGAWRLGEEDWFSNAIGDIFSNAALKTSYSLTAMPGPLWVNNSQAIYRGYVPWRHSTTAAETAVRIDDLENSELTYEKKYEFNIGLEVGILKDRISTSIDYYNRRNFDLIGFVYTEGAGGLIRKMANAASMKSSGVELSIASRNILTKDFTWNSDFIFSKTANEITALKTVSNVINMIAGQGMNFGLVGYPVRPVFSIPFVGLNEEGLPQFINEKGEVTVSNIEFQHNGDLSFLKYEGPSEPTIMGSLGNNFRWKNFGLNIFMTYSFGNKIRLNPVFSYAYSDMSLLPRELDNRWMVPGDEKWTDIPTIVGTRQYNNHGSNIALAYNAYNYSTARIADGGFIRMKEISLTYDVPKSWVKFLQIENLQMKLQGTNLFLLYADKKLNGQDPEFFNSGGVAVPMPKQFTFTLRVGI